MSIATLDGALAGMQPPVPFTKAATATLVAARPTSLWPLAGSPGAGSYSGTLGGATLSSSSTIPAGSLYHVDPGSGNSYLARLSAVSSGQAGVLLLCDRLFDCRPAVAVATAQTISSPTWPSRDAKGGTSGYGVYLAIEVSAATSSTAATISVSYTNQAGTSGQTGSFIDAPTAATNAIGNFYRISLQAGDLGVQSVQTVTFASDWTTGTINLVAYRVLAALEIVGVGIPNAIDALTGGFPQLFNGTVPFFVFIPNTTTATAISGVYIETQG